MENPINKFFDNFNLKLDEINNSIEELKNVIETENQDKMYSVEEASEITKCSKQTIRSLVKRGLIKGHRLGRKILIPHKELYDSVGEIKSLKYKR